MLFLPHFVGQSKIQEMEEQTSLLVGGAVKSYFQGVMCTGAGGCFHFSKYSLFLLFLKNEV